MSSDWNRKSILQFLAEGCTLGEAARLVGVHRQTLLRWRWDDPEFSERVAESLAKGKVERTYRMWLRHPFRGQRPPTGKGHGGKPAFQYPEGGYTNPVFTPRCVEAFRMILTAVPSAKVVFSTTWRLPNYVNRLHEQWLEHGFPLSLAMDGTPDLRNDPSVIRRQSRGLEIQRWLEANPSATRWVVVDDDRMATEEVLANDRCVFTDPTRGMTTSDARKAMAILMNAPQAFSDVPSRSVMA